MPAAAGAARPQRATGGLSPGLAGRAGDAGVPVHCGEPAVCRVALAERATGRAVDQPLCHRFARARACGIDRCAIAGPVRGQLGRNRQRAHVQHRDRHARLRRRAAAAGRGHHCAGERVHRGADCTCAVDHHPTAGGAGRVGSALLQQSRTGTHQPRVCGRHDATVLAQRRFSASLAPRTLVSARRPRNPPLRAHFGATGARVCATASTGCRQPPAAGTCRGGRHRRHPGAGQSLAGGRSCCADHRQSIARPSAAVPGHHAAEPSAVAFGVAGAAAVAPLCRPGRCAGTRSGANRRTTHGCAAYRTHRAGAATAPTRDRIDIAGTRSDDPGGRCLRRGQEQSDGCALRADAAGAVRGAHGRTTADILGISTSGATQRLHRPGRAAVAAHGARLPAVGAARSVRRTHVGGAGRCGPMFAAAARCARPGHADQRAGRAPLGRRIATPVAGAGAAASADPGRVGRSNQRAGRRCRTSGAEHLARAFAGYRAGGGFASHQLGRRGRSHGELGWCACSAGAYQFAGNCHAVRCALRRSHAGGSVALQVADST